MRSLAWTGALLAVAVLALPSALAQGDTRRDPGPVPVTVTVAVNSLGDYDAKQGSYVLDFYLVLEWDPVHAPANFTAANFEMANGRATSRDLQLNETVAETGHRRLWYRLQATLFSEPKYDSYPFDKQTVEVRIEDKVHTIDQLVYVPGNGTLEANFRAAGWQVRGTSFTVVQSNYTFDDPYSQARFVVTLQRSVLSSVLKVILPPLAFVLISAVSFLLLGKEKIATRFALTGNMAISGIMFHAAQSSTLPSLSRLIFLDRYMLAVETFLFGSVAVTALVALADLKWKDDQRSKRINLRGAIAVAAAAVGVFFLLFLVDVAPSYT